MKWEFLLSTMKLLMKKPRPVCEHRHRQEWSYGYSSRCTTLAGSQTRVLQELWWTVRTCSELLGWRGGEVVFYLQWGEPVVERDLRAIPVPPRIPLYRYPGLSGSGELNGALVCHFHS